MSPDERLAATAAVFAGPAAPRLLGRKRGGAGVVAELALRPRRERLAAFALAAAPPRRTDAGVATLVAPERAGVQRLARALFSRAPALDVPGGPALLRRLLLDLIARAP